METTSTVATAADHEVLSTSASDIPMPAVAGAAAGYLIGKSLGWAAVGGAAGYWWSKRKPAAVGCSECYGAVPMIRRPNSAPVAVSTRPQSLTTATTPTAAATKKSMLPWALAAGAAYLIFW